MRLPRLSRFYRAHREFDGLSDARCERYVWQAIIRRGDAIWIVPLAAGLAAAALWAGVGFAVVTIVATALTAGAKVDPSLVLYATAGIALAAWVFVYVGVRRVLIVRSMRAIVNRAACPFCGFSLVGLKPLGAYVICPECGENVALHEHRINPEDLIPDSEWGREQQRRTPVGAGPMGAYKGAAPKPKRTAPAKPATRRG